MNREQIKRKVDFIYDNYSGADRERRIQQFIASLGKERHEELAQELTDELENRLAEMYGLQPPASLKESEPNPIEKEISESGTIPKKLLDDPTLIEPFRSQEILRRSIERRKGKPKKTVEDLLRKFEEKLRREGL